MARVTTRWQNKLVEHRFTASKGLLVVLDGARGLRAAVRDVFGDDVAVQRCQWHKRENILSHLPKFKHTEWRRNLQAAYAHSADDDAKRAPHRPVSEFTTMNASAVQSLEEDLEETLTLHLPRLHAHLRRSLNTANLIESIMAQIERNTHRVDHWRTSEEKKRWCAATLLQIEKNFRRVRGCKHLVLLQTALLNKLHRTAA